ncbi:hypothetical protein Peur_033181 [Populus x canadensis]
MKERKSSKFHYQLLEPVNKGGKYNVEKQSTKPAGANQSSLLICILNGIRLSNVVSLQSRMATLQYD